jgi:MFS family permease
VASSNHSCDRAVRDGARFERDEVSISQIVDDLDTTVTGVQAAITAYTLVMAAFMLMGAKLGDIWGRDRAFGLGLAVYGLGSFTTALSPNLYVLLFGWSLFEGLGAVLVIPAIAALTAQPTMRGETPVRPM